MQVKRVETAPFGTNAYVIICEEEHESILIDAPGEPELLMAALEGTRPKYIVMTHGHVDHTLALKDIATTLSLPVAVHSSDAPSLSVPAAVMLEDGDILELGKVDIRVLHTPGHTPGSICLLAGGHLIAGDTLFPGGPGKTGSPSDLRLLIDSLRSKIMDLPDDTVVHPGHGEGTILGKEKEQFANFLSRSHASDLCGDVLWLEH